MPRKSGGKNILTNVICCVDTKNADGSNAGEETERILRDMGAVVESGGIRMGQTHMIWSNGNINMVKAAEFMDIVVVSPLWVEQCRESGKVVPVDDFKVSAEGFSKVKAQKTLPIPVPHVADLFQDPDEFSSSQRILAKNKNKCDKKVGVIKKSKSTHKEKFGSVNAASSQLIQEKENSSNPAITEDQTSAMKGKIASEDIARTKSSKNSANAESGMKRRRGLAVMSVSNNSNWVLDHDELKPKKQSKQRKTVNKESVASTSTSTVALKDGTTHPLTCEVSSAKKRDTSPQSGTKNAPYLEKEERVVLSLSGFGGEDRCILQNVIETLISSHRKPSNDIRLHKNKKKSKTPVSHSNYDVALENTEQLPELSLIKSMTSSTHVVCPEDGPNGSRTLRIIFAMARQVPVLTSGWVYANLDSKEKWLLSATDYKRFLHPRFNPRPAKPTTTLSVYVGPCSDPSKRVMEALVDCFFATSRASLKEASLIIMDNPNDAMHLFRMKPKNEKDHVKVLAKDGRIMSCKGFFDCIEDGVFPPHNEATSCFEEAQQKIRQNVSSFKPNILKVSSPLVAAIDDDDDDDNEGLVPPKRPNAGGKIGKRLLQGPKRLSKSRPSSPIHTVPKSHDLSSNLPCVRSDKDEDSKMDYSDCLVASPDVRTTLRHGEKRVADVADLETTILESDNETGSELSFQIQATSKCSRRRRSKSSRSLRMDEDEESEGDPTASSYQSVGSPCW